MKYLGKGSLSSFLSGFFRFSWYAVIVLAVLGSVVGGYVVFAPLTDPWLAQAARVLEVNSQDPDWLAFKHIPLALRALLVPYYAALVVLTLLLIQKARELFDNFKADVVFNRSNVTILAAFSKLYMIFSILTVNFSSLVMSLLLFLLCEIFKNGTALQEEHDLTV